MAQPDEPFGADHVAGLQADLGLVPDLEPIALERLRQRHLRLAGGITLVVVILGRSVRPGEQALKRLEHDAISSKSCTRERAARRAAATYLVQGRCIFG
jgi:hypothetical protein